MRKLMNFLNFVIAGAVCSLSIYSFGQTPLAFTLWEFIVSRTGILLTITELQLLLILLTVLYVFYLSKSQGGHTFAQTSLFFSTLYFLPTVLSHSSLNWFEIIGITFETQATFQESLFIGTIIITGYLILYFMSRVEQGTVQLKDRGASSESLRELSSKKLKYAFSLIGVSYFLAISATYLSDFFRSKTNFSTGMSSTASLLAGISIVAISLFLMLYLHGEKE